MDSILSEKNWVVTEFLFSFIPWSPVNDQLPFVHVIFRHQLGKSFSEAMLYHYSDACNAKQNYLLRFDNGT